MTSSLLSGEAARPPANSPEQPASLPSKQKHQESLFERLTVFTILPWPANVLILLGMIFDVLVFLLLSPLLLLVWVGLKAMKFLRTLHSKSSLSTIPSGH